MAGRLAQFEDEQPKLATQQVNSNAEGYDTFAKTLGQLAGAAEQKAENIEEEKSNAMFMQSANLAEQLKTQTQIQMMQNPNNANQIFKNAQYTYETIKKSAFVNEGDRQKLNYMIGRSVDDIQLKAAETSYGQAKRGIAIKFWDSYPVTMRQIETAINTNDTKSAKALEESLHANALAAASAGAITPEQYGTIVKSNYDLYDKAKELVDLSQHPDGISAQQYHAATMSPFGTTPLENIGHPVDTNTQWSAAHLNYDRTMSGQYTALYNGQPINFGVVANSSNEEYQKFKMSMIGVNQVKGAIAAGTPFNQIDARMKALESKPELNQVENSELKYWKSFKSRLNNDNSFYGLMGQTVLGAQYTANHQAQREAISASGKEGAELYEALRQNDNQYIGQMIDVSRGMHLDPNLTKPIPTEWANEVKSSFQKDAPVLPALQRIAYVNPEYRPYLAEAMQKPNQGMAVWVAGSTMGMADASFQADLISANQDNISPGGASSDGKIPTSLLLSGSNDAKTKPDNVWNDIVNTNDDMKNLYSYLGKLPGGKTSQDGFREMAVNYVYDQAQRAGDVNLVNKDQYVNTFVRNTLKGFNLYQTDKANINMNDIQVARTQDVDYLAHYALSEAYKRIHEGKSEIEFQQSLDLNPLMVISTPDRRLVVIDRYGRAAVTNDGHEAFDMPYTANMLSAATKRAGEIKNYLVNYGFSEDYQPESNTYITSQDVMLHAAAVRMRAKEQKRNEQKLRNTKEGK